MCLRQTISESDESLYIKCKRDEKNGKGEREREEEKGENLLIVTVRTRMQLSSTLSQEKYRRCS